MFLFSYCHLMGNILKFDQTLETQIYTRKFKKQGILHWLDVSWLPPSSPAFWRHHFVWHSHEINQASNLNSQEKSKILNISAHSQKEGLTLAQNLPVTFCFGSVIKNFPPSLHHNAACSKSVLPFSPKWKWKLLSFVIQSNGALIQWWYGDRIVLKI